MQCMGTEVMIPQPMQIGKNCEGLKKEDPTGSSFGALLFHFNREWPALGFPSVTSMYPS